MIDLFVELLSNRIIVAVIISCIIAQMLKPIVEFFRTQKFNINLFISSGHMPSSHTASISALTASFFVLEGISNSFIISLVLAVVIFIDATRLRMAVGRNIQALKKLTKSKEINELTGHTIPEALAGVILGTVIAVTIQIMYLV